MQHERPNEPPLEPQSGSIFTVLLAGLVAASALSLILYQALSGPVSSMVRITYDTSAKAEAESALNTIDADAVSNSSDCDSDGQIEPRPWRVPLGPAGSFPVTGGLIPDDVGAQLTDRWGTEYGYCVWDVGSTRLGPGCNGDGTYNTRRLSGSPDITLGIPGSQTAIAIISAGPNRKFETECRAYTLTTNDVMYSALDGTTAGVGGDDFAIRKTYTQMSQQNPELWALKSLDTTTAVINKNLEIGTLGSPQITVTPSTGLITTSGRFDATAGFRPGNAIANGACVAGTVGLMRYSTTAAYVEACDGTNFLGPSIDSLVDGKTDYTKFNVFLGRDTGLGTTVGQTNTATGYKALYTNSTGSNNTAVGAQALYANLNDANIGVGYRALYNNTNGNGNTAIGSQLLVFNTSGGNNTVVGNTALYNNIDGVGNTAIGFYTLQQNSHGSYNTVIGAKAGYGDTIGNFNVFVGYSAGSAGAAADQENSIAIGAETLVANPKTWVVGKKGTKQAVYEGGDGTMGIIALNSGTATVYTLWVTDYSRIRLSIQGKNGSSSMGPVFVKSRSAGDNFIIGSTATKGNSSIVAWEIVEPNCLADLPAPDGNCN